jgi:hypothetical protein
VLVLLPDLFDLRLNFLLTVLVERFDDQLVLSFTLFHFEILLLQDRLPRVLDSLHVVFHSLSEQ